jgi:hypothetical protein
LEGLLLSLEKRVRGRSNMEGKEERFIPYLNLTF